MAFDIGKARRICDNLRLGNDQQQINAANMLPAALDEIERLQKIISEPVECFGTSELITWSQELTRLLDVPENERGGLAFVMMVGCHLEKFAKSWHSQTMMEQAKRIEELEVALVGERKKVQSTLCKKCTRDYGLKWRHHAGVNRPLSEAKEHPSYLGVHIAERVLSGFFDHVEKMPMNNPGYDFICGKGFKIDAKSSCLHKRYRIAEWHFGTKRNVTADYFLCLAFDDRESLNPLHVWLVPSKKVASKTAILIADTPESLEHWKEYEKPLDRVHVCCTQLKSVAEAI